MKALSRFTLLLCLPLFAVGAGCSKETKAKETASVPQDTMLMRDLAEANRNTAAASVIDNSLSTVNTSGGASSTLAGNASENRPTNRVSPPAGSQALHSGPGLTVPMTANDAPAPTTVGLERSPANSAAARSRRDPCDSPNLTDQRYCLNRSIVANDADLNRTYQELIDQAGKSGGSDLQDRFRQSQREWINQRDSDCTSQTASAEGKLWAKARARCLADYSARRTTELQRNLGGLRGQ